MPYDEILAERIEKIVSRRKGYIPKKMFGGIGFILNGNMCVGVWKNYLILRLGQEKADEALKQDGVKPFDITGRPLTGWVMVEAPGIETDSALKSWIDEAQKFVKTLLEK